MSKDKKDFISGDNAGWWNGCTECDTYYDDIQDVISTDGYNKALKFAQKKMREPRRGLFLCMDCYTDYTKRF